MRGWQLSIQGLRDGIREKSMRREGRSLNDYVKGKRGTHDWHCCDN